MSEALYAISNKQKVASSRTTSKAQHKQVKPLWQQLLAQAFREPQALLEYLQIDSQEWSHIDFSRQDFRLLAPQPWVDRIVKGNMHDPLLRQVLPLKDELRRHEHFSLDAVGDHEAMQTPGLLQKYQGRVLLLTTGACAVHCRYCFRRHFPYTQANPAQQDWLQALEAIESDTSITEVILSGGDPLVLPDGKLAQLCQRIAAIKHVRRLRFHTRLPIVLPERINNDFLAWFHSLAISRIMVIHANHAQEIDENVTQALSALQGQGVTLLNQSVLLKGVNDNANSLSTLSQVLFEKGVIPYYLHLLDRVQGSLHFEISETEATTLMHQVRAILPGYLCPQLVREKKGEPAKVPLV